MVASTSRTEARNMLETRRLPMMPLRGTTLFPGAALPIYIGREATMRAIRRARAETGGEIAVFTQLAAEKNDGIVHADLYDLGTLCRMTAAVELADQTMKIMLEGVAR